MASILDKLTSIALLLTICFSFFGFLGSYVRGCDENTEYCGLAISLWQPFPTETPIFITLGLICTIGQTICSAASYVFSKEWFNFEIAFGASTLIAFMLGLINLIFYFVASTDGTLEAEIAQAFTNASMDLLWMGQGVALCLVSTLMQLILLIIFLLTYEYR